MGNCRHIVRGILAILVGTLVIFGGLMVPPGWGVQASSIEEFIADYGGYGVKGEWETLGTASANITFENENGSGWIILGENKYLVTVVKQYVIEKEGENSTIYEGNLTENGGIVRFAIYKDVMLGEIEVNDLVYSFGVAQTLDSARYILDQYNDHLQEEIEPVPFEDLTVPDDKLAIPATVDIDPDTINLKAKGSWITAYIELPKHPELPEFDVTQIDINTVKFDNQICVFAENNPKYGFVKDPDSYLTDHDGDGLLERMVKFDRSKVQDILQPGPRVKIEVTGSLVDGRPFYGMGWIRVIGGDCPLFVNPSAEFMTNMNVTPLKQFDLLYDENHDGMRVFSVTPEETCSLKIEFYLTKTAPVFLKILRCGNQGFPELYRISIPPSDLSVKWNSFTVTLPSPNEAGMDEASVYMIKVVGVAGHLSEVNWDTNFKDGCFEGKTAEELGWDNFEVAYQLTLKVEGEILHNPFISNLSLTPSKTELSPRESFTVAAKYYRTYYCPSDYFKFLAKNEQSGEIIELGRWARPYWQLVEYGWQTFTTTLTAPSTPGTYTVKAVGCSGHGIRNIFGVDWNDRRRDGDFAGLKPEELSWSLYEISAKFTITVTPAERIVSVLAVADEEYIDCYDDWWDPWDEDQWMSEVRKAVELGDNAFEREFGINFVVKEIGTWDSDDATNDLYKLFDEVRREIDKGTNDVMVAFTDQVGWLMGGVLGLAEAEGDDTLIVQVPSWWTDNVHQHEYSHLFGAPDHGDVREIRCIMSYAWTFEINDWCDDCYSTINSNKWREF